MYKQGTKIRVMAVANSTPKPSDRAMGIMKRAWREVSKIMGTKPKNVDAVVRKMGLKRRMPEAQMA